MYLFSRSTVVANADGLAWATNITEHAKRTTGLDIGLWGQTWSPEFGRLSWTAFVPDLEALAAAGDAMNADAAMAAEADNGAALRTAGMDDGLYNILHGEVDPSRPQAEYVTSVRSVCANGALTKGITNGIEIAQRAEKLTGAPTMFATTVTGAYGGVGWLTGFPDVKSLEAAQQAMAGDEDWAKFIDKAASAYSPEPGATQSLIFRRIA